MDKLQAKNMNALSLAFLGDSVYNLRIKEQAVKLGFKAKDLHKIANKYVCAKAQAELFDSLTLTEDEKEIADRARNADYNNIPKSATRDEYKKATSLEAVIGYNYLIGNFERIDEFGPVIARN